jgi:hypothetical protein
MIDNAIKPYALESNMTSPSIVCLQLLSNLMLEITTLSSELGSLRLELVGKATCTSSEISSLQTVLLNSLDSIRSYSAYSFSFSVYSSFRSPSFALFLLSLGWESSSKIYRFLTVLGCFFIDPFTTIAFLVFRFLVYFLFQFLENLTFSNLCSFFCPYNPFSSDPSSLSRPSPASILPLFYSSRPTSSDSLLSRFVNLFYSAWHLIFG